MHPENKREVASFVDMRVGNINEERREAVISRAVNAREFEDPVSQQKNREVASIQDSRTRPGPQEIEGAILEEYIESTCPQESSEVALHLEIGWTLGGEAKRTVATLVDSRVAACSQQEREASTAECAEKTFNGLDGREADSPGPILGLGAPEESKETAISDGIGETANCLGKGVNRLGKEENAVSEKNREAANPEEHVGATKSRGGKREYAASPKKSRGKQTPERNGETDISRRCRKTANPAMDSEMANRMVNIQDGPALSSPSVGGAVRLQIMACQAGPVGGPGQYPRNS
jgi:hypothetical protein